MSAPSDPTDEANPDDAEPNDAEPGTVARLLRERLARGPLPLPVTGVSMVGVIETGSTVRLQSSDRPRRGEIWAFVNDDGQITVHRIRELSDASVTGRGTGNETDDPAVGRDRLVGRVAEAHGPSGRRRFGPRDRLLAHLGFAIRRAMRPLRRRLRTRAAR